MIVTDYKRVSAGPRKKIGMPPGQRGQRHTGKRPDRKGNQGKSPLPPTAPDTKPQPERPRRRRRPSGKKPGAESDK
jgi:hypothetical protein